MMSFAAVAKKFNVHLGKKCLLSSFVFKPHLCLDQKTQTRTKKMHLLALIIIIDLNNKRKI
jgi:hypothetical protein